MAPPTVLNAHPTGPYFNIVFLLRALYHLAFLIQFLAPGVSPLIPTSLGIFKLLLPCRTTVENLDRELFFEIYVVRVLLERNGSMDFAITRASALLASSLSKFDRKLATGCRDCYFHAEELVLFICGEGCHLT